MTEAVLEKPKTESIETPRKRGRPVGSSRSSQDSIGKRNKLLGKKGEDAAVRFLQSRGYEVIERNWKCFVGEADVIAKDGSTIVFVEVKTRRDCERGFPSEAVNAAKRDKYEKIALAYLADYEGEECAIRFDVVSIVVMNAGKAMIRHLINAFAVA